MSTSYGFGEDFDLELEEASKPGKSFAPRKRQKPVPVVGPEIQFAKAGRFEIEIPNKQGKKVKKFPTELQVIILDGKFGRQDWREVDGKSRTVCSTVSHSVRQKDGTVKEIEGGWWQIPYGFDVTNERYNPIGTKTKPDGTPMSCAECKLAGENESCAQKGYTYVYIVGMSDEDDEMKALQKPVVATIRTPNASGIAFQIYTRRKLSESGYRPSQVVTRLSVTKTPNGLANQLAFELEDRADADVIADATQEFGELISKWEAEEQRKAEERRAKYQAANDSGAKPRPRASSDDFAAEDDFTF